jgi:hypothetical protein
MSDYFGDDRTHLTAQDGPVFTLTRGKDYGLTPACAAQPATVREGRREIARKTGDSKYFWGREEVLY